MTSDEATGLPTEELPHYIEACGRAIEIVAPFASDALLDALEAEQEVLSATVAVRALPSTTR